MFSKKQKCKKCNEKISDKYSYCPSCGAPLKPEKKEDWGMLGKNDTVDPFEAFEKGMLGGMGGKMLNKMIGSAMKMLENEMRKNMKNTPQKDTAPKTNFELYINGKKISPKNIKVTRKEVPQQNKKPQKINKNFQNYFGQDSIKKYSNLEKIEPKANIRRLSNKVIYEIDVPGVESIKDISVVKLENSIEIKAVSKEKAYKKTIPIDLPLKKYRLDNEKLILELDVKD